MIALTTFVLTMAVASPSGAHTYPGATPVEWEALPCAVACSYWINNGFTPCSNPFPPGSFDDVRTAPAPEREEGKVIVLEATLDPVVDWDLFLCVGNPPTDQTCTTGECVTIIGEPCDTPLGPNHIVPAGCHEDASTPVSPGQTVILRAYNWSDPLPATGSYWFRII